MKTRRLLPYLIALLLLAWILGSLARSGTEGGSLLSGSYWLVYLVELLPLAAVGFMIVLTVSLLINWRLLSDALGFGMARRRAKPRKKNRTLLTIVWLSSWLVAIAVLWVRCGGLFCRANGSALSLAGSVKNIVTGQDPFPQLPILSPVLALANLVDTNFLVFSFLGILAVSSVIMVRAFKVSWDESKSANTENTLLVQAQGREAVQEAMRVLDEDENGEPRVRIIRCYERMIKAAADLGAPVGPDRTARELEKGIRGMLLLKGPGIANLTRLFEEARYSLHAVSEEDAGLARECLVEIQDELTGTVSLEA